MYLVAVKRRKIKHHRPTADALVHSTLSEAGAVHSLSSCVVYCLGSGLLVHSFRYTVIHHRTISATERYLCIDRVTSSRPSYHSYDYTIDSKLPTSLTKSITVHQTYSAIASPTQAYSDSSLDGQLKAPSPMKAVVLPSKIAPPRAPKDTRQDSSPRCAMKDSSCFQPAT